MRNRKKETRKIAKQKERKRKVSHFDMGQPSTHTKEYSYFISFYNATIVFEEVHSSSLVSGWNPVNYTEQRLT